MHALVALKTILKISLPKPHLIFVMEIHTKLRHFSEKILLKVLILHEICLTTRIIFSLYVTNMIMSEDNY